MKKFTKSFSSGGYRGSLRILRLLALGLVALVGLQTAASAQCAPPPGTVTYIVEGTLGTVSVNDCYNGDNVYWATIYVEDFINVDSFDLKLDFDEQNFNFLADSTMILNPAFNSTTAGAYGTNMPLTATEVNGEVVMQWVEWASRVNLPGQTAIAKIAFEIKFPLLGSLWATDLDWNQTTSQSFVCGGADNMNLWTDAVAYVDGRIGVEPKGEAPTVSIDSSACSGEMTTIKVLDPVGDGWMYKYNNSAWTETDSVQVPAGYNTVQAMSPDGCVTPLTIVEHDGTDALDFETVIGDANCGINGSVSFVGIEESLSDLTYWVVPAADYVAGDPNGNDPMYSYPEDVVGVQGGAYWVAVENACGQLQWDSVFVGGIDFTMDIVKDKDTLLCFGGMDAEFQVDLGSDSVTTWVLTSPSLDSTYVVSGVDTANVVMTGFGPGEHVIYAEDSTTGCIKYLEVDVMDGEAITAYVGYEDAPCDSATGAIWISEVNGVALEDWTAADTAGYSFNVYFPGYVDSTLAIGDTLMGLEPLVYQVFIIQDTCGVKNPIQNDDGTYLWPILSGGSIEATATTEGIACFGDTAYVTVNVTAPTTGVFEYQVYKDSLTGTAIAGDFVPVDSMLAIDSTGMYVVVVKDTSDASGLCQLVLPLDVEGPDTALTVTIDNITPPSCPGGNDGRINVTAMGGTPPYYFALDNEATYQQGTQGFGLTEGTHILYIKDAMGCKIDTTFSVDSVAEFLIEAWASNDTSICVDAMTGIRVELDTTYADSTGYTIDNPGFTFYYNTTGTEYASGTEFIPDTLANSTSFPRGTYYVWATSPFGCLSNMEKVEFAEVDSLVIDTIIYDGATCAGTWTGSVLVHIEGGVPDTVAPADGDFYYAYYNNDIFETADPEDIVWTPFAADSLLELVGLQEGTYYLRIKDACSQTPTDTIIIDGYEPVSLDTVTSTPVKCAVGGNDGTITVEAISGGGPAEGVGDYIYALYLTTPDTMPTWDTMIMVADWDKVNTWTGLVSGMYTVLGSDNAYIGDGFDEPCSVDTFMIRVNMPDTLVFENIGLVDATCGDSNDGVIGIKIGGGIGGPNTWNPKSSAPDGMYYTVTINGITNPDENYSLELDDLQDSVTFGVSGGDYEIVVVDQNGEGCVIDSIVTVIGPAPWEIIEIVDSVPSDCNEQDGGLSMVVMGGLDTSMVADSLQTIWYSVNGGDWINSGLYAGDTIPVIPDTAIYEFDYVIEVTNDTGGFFCSGIDTFTITIDNPFDFVVEIEDALCYGTASGTVTLDSITGGSEDSYYQVQFVNINDSTSVYQPDNDTVWFPNLTYAPAPSKGPFTVKDVPAGTYWVYLRSFIDLNDGVGSRNWKLEYTLDRCCRPIQIIVGEPDSLMINELTLINNVECYGDSTGSFSIQAEGGMAPYEYYVERTWIDEGHPFPPAVPADSVMWMPDSIVDGLTVGTYIVWVKDANGCIVGGEVDENGDPIDKHRIVISTANAVIVDSLVVNDELCYGDLGSIELWNVQGGSAVDSITFELKGMDRDSMMQEYVFGPYSLEDMDDFILEDIVPTDTVGYYVLTVKNDAGCEGGGDTIHIMSGDYFEAFVEVVGSAGCVGDQEVLIVLSQEGGEGTITYDLYQDGILFKEQTDIENHVVPVGYTYQVEAFATGDSCTAWSDELPVAVPEDIIFDIKNVSCYGDTLASAKVIVNGTEGRMFYLHYRELETNGPEMKFGPFMNDTVASQMFDFDDTNIADRHYEMWISDGEGCTAEKDTITFDEVDGPLQVVNVVANPIECFTSFAFEIAGGTAPYSVWVDTMLVADSIGFYEQISIELGGGMHNVYVLDEHECRLEYEFDLDYSVERDTTIEIYEGDTAHFVDTEAMVDTMLVGGVYEFFYNTGSDSSECTSLLTVTVIENERVAPVLDTLSPDGDTIADNHPMLVLTFTDDVTFGDMGYVTVTAKDSAAATMEIPVTAEMFSGNTVTIDYDWQEFGSLELNTTYVVTVDSGVVMGDGLAWNGLNDDTWMFTTGDSVATDVDDIPTFDVEFKVYPNPFNNFIRIDNHDKLDRVIVSNIAGQRVLDIEYPSYEIRTGNLVTGVYVVTLISNDEIVKSDRIIKR